MCRKNKKHYLIIILYGIILIAVMLGIGNLFGSNVDWLGQHIVFPDTFRQAFYESKQLIPNFLFDIGGGQNAFNFIYYGFLSPGILLSYLLPFVDMTTYIICLCIVSYLASGVLVYHFLKCHFGEINALWAAILFLTLPPMTYHFHRHIMFVWYMPYFILSLMGLDRYFEKKKSGLFIISAFLMIMTNYYFSVGGLIFLFVYAVYRILQEEPFAWNRFIKRIFSNIFVFIIPVLLSAFVLLPTAYALFANGRTSTSSEEILNLIVPLYEEYFYSPYSMGISAVMLFTVFGNLTCRTRKKADIFLNAVSIFILICPLFMYALNGMLYVRGKVLIAYSIIFLYNFCQFVERVHRKEINMKLTMLLSVGFVVLFVLLRTDNWWIGLLLLTELALTWCLKNKKKTWHIFPVIVSFIASCAVNTSESYVSIDYYEKMYNDEIVELMEHTEGNFYRTNVMYREKNTANKVYGEKFHGSSVYSSTANGLYQEFYENYTGNNEKYRNSLITSGAENELFYNFMGTQYIIGKRDPGLYYEQIKEGENLNLYENKYAYPVVYKSGQTINEEQFDKTEFPYSTEYLMTNTVVKDGSETNYESQIKRCDISENCTFIQEQDETYTIELDEEYRNKIVYLTFDITNEGDYLNDKDVSITINGIKNKLTAHNWLYYNGNTKFDYVIPMEDSIVLTIEITKGKYDIRNLKMYTSEMLCAEYEEANDLVIDEYSGEITCNAEAKEGEYLVTSIPYDKGFSAYINGEEVEVEIVNKAFVGMKLQEGNNDIVIKYASPLFTEGVIVSLLGVLLLLIALLKTRIQGIFEKHREIFMYLVFGILTTVVSLITYFICTTLFLDADHAVQLQVANVISWIVSVMFAYVTNRKYVFKSHNSVVKEMAKFYLSRGGTLVIDMLLMYGLVTVSGIDDGLAKIVVQVIVIAVNYVFGKLLVFKGEYK